MVKVCAICVNYNSVSDLVRYAKSIYRSVAKTAGMYLTFAVADNSSETSESDSRALADLLCEYPEIVVEKYNNLGYLPAASRLWNSLVRSDGEYDYVVVSNVDLELSEDFFRELSSMPKDSAVGVLAPAVISRRGADLNPKIASRPGRAQLIKNKMLFERLPLYLFYVALSNLKYKIRGKSQRFLPACEIYAPHGAIMIFTGAYVRRVGNIAYPMFLYGEEVFVAEECRRHGLTVRYEPALRVSDFDHGATSMQGAGFRAAEHAKSLGYLLNTYF